LIMRGLPNFAELCARSPVMCKIMHAHNRIHVIPRSLLKTMELVSFHTTLLQSVILLIFSPYHWHAVVRCSLFLCISRHSIVSVSVHLSFCMLVTQMSCTKTAEAIEMPFWGSRLVWAQETMCWMVYSLTPPIFSPFTLHYPLYLTMGWHLPHPKIAPSSERILTPN